MSSASFSFCSEVNEEQLWGLNVVKSQKKSYSAANFTARRIDIPEDMVAINSKGNLQALRRGKTATPSNLEVWSLCTREIWERFSVAKEKEIALKKDQFKVEQTNMYDIENASRQKLIESITTVWPFQKTQKTRTTWS